MNFSFAFEADHFEEIRASVQGWVDRCDGDIEEAALSAQHFHRWALAERAPGYVLACATNPEWTAALADMPAADLAFAVFHFRSASFPFFALVSFGCPFEHILGTGIAWLQESPQNRVTAALEGDAPYTLALLGIFGPLFWLTVWKRQNWARWVLLLAFIAYLPLDFVDFHGRPFPLTSLGLMFLSSVVEASAFYFLFTGDARPWFNWATGARV